MILNDEYTVASLSPIPPQNLFEYQNKNISGKSSGKRETETRENKRRRTQG